jgi:octaprenyl-diphosphate synthase
MATVVSLEEKRRAGSGIDALLRLCAEDFAKVDHILSAKMQSPVGLIPELASHLVDAGGKRLRPLLTIAAAKLCGYASQREDHVKLAACVELIHSATLLHDDVVDRSLLRRGKPSANAVWGDKASVLVGDFLFTRAFELMVDVGSLDTLGTLSRASSTIAEGEVLQLVSANHISTGETTYLEVIRGKTAKLFAAAAEVGAITAAEARARQGGSAARDQRAQPERRALESFGLNLGIAFQLVDDALDYGGRQAKLGKELGDDFREGKITLPVILAFHRGDSTEREFWKRVMETPEAQEPADFQHGLDLMLRQNSIHDTMERARHYGAVARDALGLFPDSVLKRALLEAVDFAVERTH